MPLSPDERARRITLLRHFPHKLREAVAGLTDEALTTRWLEGEWSVAQNVHHVADSHLNSYLRIKLILTEDQPTLRLYDQDAWAERPDATTADMHASLSMLDGLHARWGQVFSSLSEAEWARTGLHPEIGQMSLDDFLVMYSDHCEAHLEQIARTEAARRD